MATGTPATALHGSHCKAFPQRMAIRSNVRVAPFQSRRLRFRRAVRAEQEEGTAVPSDRNKAGVGLQAVWYGAEQFGKLVGMNKGPQRQQPSTSNAPARKLGPEEIVSSIREDYDNNYFVSGAGDMAAYAEDCVFADPFVSFSGVKRFKQNVGNLGGLMKDIKLEIFDWQEASESIKTKWRFSCILDLPWRPRLAASGGTTHILDLERGLVVKHIEEWNIEPSKVVAQLLRPASRVPESRWEVFMNSLADGDTKGMWLAINTPVVKLVAPVVAVSLATKLVTGSGLPGPFLGTLEGISWLLLVSGCVTEVVKFTKGMQGGETGSGGDL